MEIAGADPGEGMSAERPSQPDPLGFGTHGRHVSADTTFVLGFRYLVRMINLACAVSIGTTGEGGDDRSCHSVREEESVNRTDLESLP